MLSSVFFYVGETKSLCSLIYSEEILRGKAEDFLTRDFPFGQKGKEIYSLHLFQLIYTEYFFSGNIYKIYIYI